MRVIISGEMEQPAKSSGAAHTFSTVEQVCAKEPSSSPVHRLASVQPVRVIWTGLGFTVWAGVRRKEDGEALARSTSARLRVLLLDVTDPDSITAATRTLTEALPEAGLSAS